MEKAATIEVSPVEDTIKMWANSVQGPDDLRRRLESAHLLILPRKGHSDRPNLVYFPSGTENLHRFAEKTASRKISIEVCSSDEQYVELSLYADIFELGLFIVQYVTAELAIAILAEYIKYKVLGEDEADIEVHAEFIVDDAEAKTSHRFSYRGPADKFESTYTDALEAYSKSRTQSLEKVRPVSKDKHRKSRRGRK